MSNGINRTDTHRQAGVYAGPKSSRAKSLADLPVQAATKYNLAINLKTAKALGIDIPSTLLAIADEVIE
jgi:putative ABC transport system substrate-binding protein